jgi:hypothetical protein
MLVAMRIILVIKYREKIIGEKNNEYSLLDVIFKFFNLKKVTNRELRIIMIVLNIGFISTITFLILAAIVFFTSIYTFPL